jgi:hypothetical protein
LFRNIFAGVVIAARGHRFLRCFLGIALYHWVEF